MTFLTNPYRFGSAPPPSGISFVGSKTVTFAGSTAGGTHNVSLTDLKDNSNNNATLQENDFIIIAYAMGVGSNTNVSFSAPSGWTQRADLYQSATAASNLAIWYKKMGSSPDTSVDVPTQASLQNIAVTIMAFRGVNTTTPFDVTDTTAGASATANPNPAAITPATSGAWIVIAAGSSVRQISGLFGPYSQGGDLSSATNEFRSVVLDVDGSDSGAASGIGIKKDWTAGSFDAAAWGGLSTHSSSSYVAITMALRPA